jgi:hypothetical protein
MSAPEVSKGLFSRPCRWHCCCRHDSTALQRLVFKGDSWLGSSCHRYILHLKPAAPMDGCWPGTSVH